MAACSLHPPKRAKYSPEQQHFRNALASQCLFKLIGGGSLTDAQRLGSIAQVYALAGAQCVDVAPCPDVVESVDKALSDLPDGVVRPLLMVSLPLDPDPHFRKMYVDEDACTGCDACTPVCPTQALSVNHTTHLLDVEQPLCYGCGRCVPVCPTEALSMSPHHPDASAVLPVLHHPRVEAVEIHSGYADEALIEPFMVMYGEALMGKQLAVCFQAGDIPPERWLPFVDRWIQIQQQVLPEARLVIQVDGRPMSGGLTSHSAETEQPAIDAAKVLWGALSPAQRQQVDVMLSGGVNAKTAQAVQRSGLHFIAGAGMGTVARMAVWDTIRVNHGVDHQGRGSMSRYSDQGQIMLDDPRVLQLALQRARQLTQPILQGLGSSPLQSILNRQSMSNPSKKFYLCC